MLGGQIYERKKMSLSSEVNAQAARKKVTAGLKLLDHDNFNVSNDGSNIRVHLDHGKSLVAQ